MNFRFYFDMTVDLAVIITATIIIKQLLVVELKNSRLLICWWVSALFFLISGITGLMLYFRGEGLSRHFYRSLYTFHFEATSFGLGMIICLMILGTYTELWPSKEHSQ